MSYSGAGATTNAQSQNNAQPGNTQTPENNNQSNPESNSQTNDLSSAATNIPQPGVSTNSSMNPLNSINASNHQINSSGLNTNPLHSNPIQSNSQQHSNLNSNPSQINPNQIHSNLPQSTGDSIPYTASSAAAAAGSYPHIIQNSDLSNPINNQLNQQIPNPVDHYNQNLTMLQANSQLSSPSAANPNGAQNYANPQNPGNVYQNYNGATTPTGASTTTTSTEWTNAGAAAAQAAATANPYAMQGYTAAAMAGAYGPMGGAPGGALGYADPSAAYGYGGYGYDMSDGVRRKNATIRESTNTLKAWLNEHKKNPYPTKGEKIMLAIITKMTLTQVSTWFANARRRLKKENKMTWVPKNRSADDNSGKSDDEEGGNPGNNTSQNSGLQITTDSWGNGDGINNGTPDMMGSGTYGYQHQPLGISEDQSNNHQLTALQQQQQLPENGAAQTMPGLNTWAGANSSYTGDVKSEPKDMNIGGGVPYDANNSNPYGSNAYGGFGTSQFGANSQFGQMSSAMNSQMAGTMMGQTSQMGSGMSTQMGGQMGSQIGMGAPMGSTMNGGATMNGGSMGGAGMGAPMGGAPNAASGLPTSGNYYNPYATPSSYPSASLSSANPGGYGLANSQTVQNGIQNPVSNVTGANTAQGYPYNPYMVNPQNPMGVPPPAASTGTQNANATSSSTPDPQASNQANAGYTQN